MRMPNGELMSTSPITGLRTGTATSAWLISVDLRAGEIDAVELAVEGAGAGARRLQRHEGAADTGIGGAWRHRRRDRRARCACGAPWCRSFFQVGRARRSAGVRPCRARRNAREHAVEPAGVAAVGDARRVRRQFARLQPRLAVGRCVKIIVSLIGARLSIGFAGWRRVARRLDRAGGEHIAASARCAARASPGVAAAR